MRRETSRALARIGFSAGLAAFSATVAYDLVQILQVVGVLRFPFDDILIFATSLCIVVPFVFEILVFHYSTAEDKRFWTHAALIFTTAYAVYGSANYVIQLTTVIPAKLQGNGAAFRLLEQTPHSLLWDFDALAYIAMGLASLVLVPALGRSGIERWARLVCMSHVGATVLACVVYFNPLFSNTVLLLGLPWAVTAPLFMCLVAVVIRRRLHDSD